MGVCISASELGPASGTSGRNNAPRFGALEDAGLSFICKSEELAASQGVPLESGGIIGAQVISAKSRCRREHNTKAKSLFS